MDEECLHESGVMFIRANRALIRGSCMLPDGSGPYLMYHYSGKPLKEKIALAECIEAVLGRPEIAVGADVLPEHKTIVYDNVPQTVMMVAEDPVPYRVKKEGK